MAKLRSPDHTPGKVLVIQTAFLGDIVLATSFLSNLRRILPAAEIRLLTTPVGAKVLEANAQNVIPIAYDKRGKDKGAAGFLRMAKTLRAFHPELVFCLHRSLRSTLLARVSGGETYGFHDGAGSVLFDRRVNRPKEIYEAEKNQAMLAAWAGPLAENLPLFPQLGMSQEDTVKASALLEGLTEFVAFAPSSVWGSKRWPADRFARLAELLWERRGLRAVLVGGNDEADFEAAREITKAVRLSGKKMPLPLDLIGKTSLGSLKGVLARALLLIANDTAPLHVGIAVGAPVLGIFGPTTRSLGFFPLAPEGKSAVAEHPNMPCRPCGLHGHHRCPLVHFRCMLELGPEDVYLQAEGLLCR
jgi:heptosyltransferase-2